MFQSEMKVSPLIYRRRKLIIRSSFLWRIQTGNNHPPVFVCSSANSIQATPFWALVESAMGEMTEIEAFSYKRAYFAVLVVERVGKERPIKGERLTELEPADNLALQ